RKGYVTHINNSANPIEINVEGSVYMLEWSPGGNQLAITVSPTSTIDDFYMKQAVKIVNPSTGNITAAIDNKGKIGQIEWSPKADQLAIRAGADINDPIDGSILVASANGGTPTII